MGVLDSVQDVIVELAGVIVFLVGVWWFVGGSLSTGVAGILVGLVMMGYKRLPQRIKSIYQ
jgi:hypothetical protein